MVTWGWLHDNPGRVYGDLGVASWQPQDGRWPGCGLPTTQGRSVTRGWPNDNPGMVLQWPGGWPRDNPWMVNDLGVASWQPLDGQWPGIVLQWLGVASLQRLDGRWPGCGLMTTQGGSNGSLAFSDMYTVQSLDFAFIYYIGVVKW